MTDDSGAFGDYVIVRSFPNVTEASLAAGLLQSAGIEVRFGDEYAAVLYPMDTPIGGVKLLVPQASAADAEAILAAQPKVVVFACVHNAGRSQMAEAFFNKFADAAKAFAVSAGTHPASKIHREVVEVMRESGFDLADAVPRELTDSLAGTADYLVTMGCGEECPVFPDVAREDWELQDPKGQPLDTVRVIRDQIQARVYDFVKSHGWM